MSPWDYRQCASPRWVGLPRRIALGFAVALLSLVAAATFASRALHGLAHSGELVAGVLGGQLAIEDLESGLLVADTALEAHLATAKAEHDALHLRAAGKIPPALAALRAIANQEAVEPERLAALARLVEVVRAEHAEVRALAAAGRAAEGRALRARGGGAAALGRVLVEIDRLEEELQAVRAARLARWSQGVLFWKSVFGVSLAALAVLLLLGARLVRDEIRARERNEQERERAIAVQRRLMAVVSHDLRNPLGSVVTGGWTLSRMALAEDAAVIVRRIVGAGRRMERLIRDLLDWSRVHGGADIPLHVCESDLYEVCRRIADELSDRHAGRLELERRGDTRGAFDPDRMEQVIANLVGNALQYAPPDSRVHVRAEGERGSVRLVVRDEGPGLPPEARDDLFKPFRRGAEHGEHSGLGLGLFIVRTLAEAQGGRIEVDSAPGAGTTFVVTLPGPRPAGGAARREPELGTAEQPSAQ